MKFKNLHEQEAPLLICNVWDVATVRVAEKLKFQAVGTSSIAIANMLGYEDGEALKFSELVYIVERLAVNTKLPLTVDLEAGYSRDPLQIASHIKALVAHGVVGINIEDSVVDGDRKLLDAKDFAQTLVAIKTQLEKEKVDVFLNVRTDPFILNLSNALDETKKRILLYEEAGADGLFIPCIVEEDDIKTAVRTTQLPINVMCMPKLPNFSRLQELGVKRISMGNFLYNHMTNHFENMLNSIHKANSFNPLF